MGKKLPFPQLVSERRISESSTVATNNQPNLLTETPLENTRYILSLGGKK